MGSESGAQAAEGHKGNILETDKIFKKLTFSSSCFLVGRLHEPTRCYCTHLCYHRHYRCSGPLEMRKMERAPGRDRREYLPGPPQWSLNPTPPHPCLGNAGSCLGA
jgi:hypothetical protein